MCVVIMFIELNLLVSFLYSNFPSFLLITILQSFEHRTFFSFPFPFFFPQKEDSFNEVGWKGYLSLNVTQRLDFPRIGN